MRAAFLLPAGRPGANGGAAMAGNATAVIRTTEIAALRIMN